MHDCIVHAFQIKDVDWNAGTWLPLQLLPLRSPPGEEGVRHFLFTFGEIQYSFKMYQNGNIYSVRSA